MTRPDEAAFEILADPEALARRAAEWLVGTASATQGNLAVALSGGSTPRRLYELMAQEPYRAKFPWTRAHLFWGDERFVPHRYARSNYRMVRDTLLKGVPVPPENVHAIPTDGVTPDDAARAYEHTLKSYYGAETLDPARPLFDLTLLGLGEDGHVASLFPATPELSERERWVAAVTGDTLEPRITLTFPPLESSRRVLFLVAGERKRPAFERVRRGDMELPATRLRPAGSLVWLVDAAAAGVSGAP